MLDRTETEKSIANYEIGYKSIIKINAEKI